MRVDADDFGRPCRCGKEHHIEIREILIEEGAIEKLEEDMSEGFLKEYISPLLICDTNTYQATEEIMEEIFDRCQVIVLDTEELRADDHAVEIVENNMDEDIDLILAVGTGTIHDISRYVANKFRIPFISVPTAASTDRIVSKIAKMIWAGEPQQVCASAPLSVYADTRIFANAPERLNIDGASELLDKYSDSDDHRMFVCPTEKAFCDYIADMMEKAFKAVRNSVKGIKEGEPDECERLMYGQILSGLLDQIEDR